MDGDHCVEEKMGCSGSVTRLDGASERESLLFEEEVTKENFRNLRLRFASTSASLRRTGRRTS